MADDLRLTRFYQGWDGYQNLLVEAIRGLTSEQLSLQAAPTLRPIGVLAAHIIGARVGWFHGIMGEAPGRPDLDDMDTWDEVGRPARSGAELAAGLQTTWEMIDGCLRRWSPDDLDQIFTTRRGAQRTRQWIIWHVIEHDVHHGGELSFTLGMNGLPAPDL